MALLALVLAAVGPAAHADEAAPDLLAVDAHRGEIVAVGQKGKVVHRDRKGDSWNQHQVPTTVAIHDVDLTPRRHIWTAGEGGQYLYYDRKSWTSPPGATSRSFHGIAMAHRRRGVAVGHKGRIFQLLDGRWEQFYAVPVKVTFRAVARVGSDRRERFVAVGEGGVAVALSGVGGKMAADREVTGATGDLVAVAACSGSRAELVAGGAEVVLRDRDGGRWTALPAPPAPVTGLLVDCRRGRATRVVATSGARLLVLEVGGESWTEHPVEGATRLNDLARVDRKTLVVVGAAGFKALVPDP